MCGEKAQGLEKKTLKGQCKDSTLLPCVLVMTVAPAWSRQSRNYRQGSASFSPLDCSLCVCLLLDGLRGLVNPVPSFERAIRRWDAESPRAGWIAGVVDAGPVVCLRAQLAQETRREVVARQANVPRSVGEKVVDWKDRGEDSLFS